MRSSLALSLVTEYAASAGSPRWRSNSTKPTPESTSAMDDLINAIAELTAEVYKDQC